jgi:hypothetical protein
MYIFSTQHVVTYATVIPTINSVQTCIAYSITRRYSIDHGLTGAAIPSRGDHPVPIFGKKLVEVGGASIPDHPIPDQVDFFIDLLVDSATGWIGRDGRHAPLHYVHGLEPVWLLLHGTEPGRANVLTCHQ